MVVTLSNGTNFDFKADGSVASATGLGLYNNAFYANTTGNTNFDKVLNQFLYDDGPKTITLNNLTPGQRYAVQLFALDDRWYYGTPPLNQADFQDPMNINDVSAMFTMGANVSVMGVFTAVTNTQTIIEQLPGTSTGANVGSGNINALVVYSLQGSVIEAPISWTGSRISGPGDVITNGSLVMAYMLGNPSDNFTVNGVNFAPDPGSILTQAGGSVSIDPSITNQAFYVFGSSTHFGQTNADGSFTAYGLMISSGRYGANGAYPITISGLTPGQTYLLELWDGDDRGLGGQNETFRIRLRLKIPSECKIRRETRLRRALLWRVEPQR